MTKKILVADDEPNIVTALEFLLQSNGFEVQVARNGDEALDLIESGQPDLVLLDVMMPKMNGFEVCRAIKGDLGLAGTTVVMLTAKGQAYDREEGLAAGADRYLTKPFDPDELLDIARAALGLGAAG